MSTVQDNNKQWVMAADGHAPQGTLVGGHDSTGETIYVARASHKGDVIPGKLITSHGCAFVSWNGEEIRKTEYEVLVGTSNNWIATSGSNTLPGAFPGGKIKSGEKLFVGRVHHEGSITTGKIQESQGACYIPYGGKELRFTDYEYFNASPTLLDDIEFMLSFLSDRIQDACAIFSSSEDIYQFVIMSKVEDDKNKWVKSSNGQAPPGTLVGGHDINGEPIYVARASHNGDLIPGKMVASQHCTYISWGGLEFKKDDYEVLVGGSNKWIATSFFNVPSDALPGGKNDIGDILYVGRVHFNGSITTGKVHKSLGACYIPYDGKELRFDHYEVLTY